MKEFKAGDFTSGKMGEIFKECYFNSATIINHKQFGKSYMIPVDMIRIIVLNITSKRPNFKDFADGFLFKGSTIQDIGNLDQEKQLMAMCEFYEEDFDTWFEMLTAL